MIYQNRSEPAKDLARKHPLQEPERSGKMASQEVARKDWSRFFRGFNLRHEGWLATLEVFGAELGAEAVPQLEARQLPFEGISLMPADGGPESIVINVGKSQANHFSHMIREPKHVWVQRTAKGADASLEIEAGGEFKTLLHFRSQMPPEFVDDVIPT